jgi:hypothetical protein
MLPPLAHPLNVNLVLSQLVVKPRLSQIVPVSSFHIYLELRPFTFPFIAASLTILSLPLIGVDIV